MKNHEITIVCENNCQKIKIKCSLDLARSGFLLKRYYSQRSFTNKFLWLVCLKQFTVTPFESLRREMVKKYLEIKPNCNFVGC